MKKSFLISISLIFSCALHAGDGEFSIGKIPPFLLKNANAVTRIHEIHFEIINTKETVLKEHYAITILNEKGDDWAQFSEYYDKHRSVESVEGYLYDAFGKQLKKIKKKDTQDLSGVDEGTLMSDARYKQHNFYTKNYPYTIEYFVQINDRSTLFFPAWVPQDREGIAVEKSTLTIQFPLDYKVRYKAFNYNETPVATEQKKDRLLTWTASNLPAVWKESFSPLWHELTTMVILGPGDFQMDDYKGNMVNWQDFGKFIYSLKAGRDQLPDQVKQTVHLIGDPIKDIKEKIARLYEYMQKNTHYISIQLGIGGWQPFDAKEVATKGYGDCKALTNYMYSILKEEGIPSYYALVRAGNGSRFLTEDFPSQQFNHVILCVPLQKDTIWLECTSQTKHAGYLGNFTDDRAALLIDETGGKLVHTPKYTLNDNLQVRKIKALLEEDGTLKVAVDTRYQGLQQDDIHEMMHSLSREKMKEYLHGQLDFGTYDIDKFSYKQEKSSPPCIDETLQITVSNYATITGKRMFIIPNIMSRSGRKLRQDSARKYDIELGFEYKDVDSVQIALPRGFSPEAMPPPVMLFSKFGNYSCSVKLVDNKLYYYRSIEHFSGRYNAASYAELVKFYDRIYKADRAKVVLVRS